MISKENFCTLMNAYTEHLNVLEAGFDAFGIMDAFDSKLYESLYPIEDAIAKDIGDWDEGWGSCLFDFIHEYNCGKEYKDGQFLFELDGVEYKPETFEDFYDCIVNTQRKLDDK